MALLEFDPDVLKSVCPELCTAVVCDNNAPDPDFCKDGDYFCNVMPTDFGFMTAEIAALCVVSCVPLDCEPLSTSDGGDTDGGGGSGGSGGDPVNKCYYLNYYSYTGWLSIDYYKHEAQLGVQPRISDYHGDSFEVRYRLVAIGALGSYYSARHTIDINNDESIQLITLKNLDNIIDASGSVEVKIIYYVSTGTQFESCGMENFTNFIYSIDDLQLDRVDMV